VKTVSRHAQKAKKQQVIACEKEASIACKEKEKKTKKKQKPSV
jgi:hypothetical protein